MDEVSGDEVVSLDCSRRALATLAPYFSPPHAGCPPPLGSLECLDASRNVLSHTRGLEHLPRLRALNLYFNRIEQLSELLRLRPAAASLHTLDLRLNPVARLEGYRGCVVLRGRLREFSPPRTHTKQRTHPSLPRTTTPPNALPAPRRPAALCLRCCPRWRCWTKRR